MGEQIIPFGKMGVRLGLWATPEPRYEGDMQLNSMVSMSMFASILKRYLQNYDLPYKWFYGYVDDPSFRKRFDITVRALKAVKAMANARVGWVGGVSPGFYNMIFDERKLEKNLGGARVFEHELSEVVAMAREIEEAEAEAVANEAASAAAEIQVTTVQMVKVSRLYLALKKLAAEHNYTALAVECWPKFQSQFEVAPCMAYSWLGSEDGMAVACEGDVQGALSMQLLNELTQAKGSATLLDMAALDPDSGTAMMWHCGVSPRHFANKNGIKWVKHSTLGRKSENGGYGVAGDLVFAPQQTTMAYIGDSARSLLVLGSRVVERDVKGMDGTRGWFTEFQLNCLPIDLWDLVNTVTVRGLEHHFAVGQGDVTEELMEVAAWMKMTLIEKIPYRNYLQIEVDDKGM